MDLPFSRGEFFDVFRQYNEAVWPAQLALNVVALAIVASFLLKRHRLGWSLLSLLWIWTAVAYHWISFSPINPAARGFAVAFVVASFVFFWTGVVRPKFDAGQPNRARQLAGWTIIAYALIGYPAAAALLGQSYPAVPTFGAPCPLTIFTIGLLLADRSPLRISRMIVPVLWSAVATSAAVKLGVVEDFGLPVAAAVAIGFTAAERFRPAAVALPLSAHRITTGGARHHRQSSRRS